MIKIDYDIPAFFKRMSKNHSISDDIYIDGDTATVRIVRKIKCPWNLIGKGFRDHIFRSDPILITNEFQTFYFIEPEMSDVLITKVVKLP